MNLKKLTLALWLVTGLAPTALQAADPACRTMIDALGKMYSMPVHVFMSTIASYQKGKTTSSEAIYLNHAVYIFVNGKWRLSRMSEQDRLDMRKAAEDKSANVTCRVVREDPVAGEAATLYNAHQQDPDTTIDTQIWISKKRGLPVKQVTDMDVGGMAGKSHKTIRYDYANVQAPPGVQ